MTPKEAIDKIIEDDGEGQMVQCSECPLSDVCCCNDHPAETLRAARTWKHDNIIADQPTTGTQKEMVEHPDHYGGADNPYEAIKVLEALDLGHDFCLGSALKYLFRAGKKGSKLEDLKKAAWYINRLIQNEEE